MVHFDVILAIIQEIINKVINLLDQLHLQERNKIILLIYRIILKKIHLNQVILLMMQLKVIELIC